MGGRISNASQIAVEYLLCNANDKVIEGIEANDLPLDVSLEEIIF
jgi:hypothetical protein